MERQSLLDYIRPKMNEKRYVHTLGVVDLAMELAKLYGEDVQKAEIAAILHDASKFEEEEQMRTIVREHGLDPRLIAWGPEILHGPIAAWRAQQELNIEDVDILNAICYHTTGRANMSRLEQIIYVADMLEVSRKFDGVEQLREIARTDLQQAMKACIQHSIAFLVATEQPIYALSLECYNDYMGEE